MNAELMQLIVYQINSYEHEDCCTDFFSSPAVEVTDEDINSPLVSYLLAKTTTIGIKDHGLTKQQDHQRGYTKVY